MIHTAVFIQQENGFLGTRLLSHIGLLMFVAIACGYRAAIVLYSPFKVKLFILINDVLQNFTIGNEVFSDNLCSTHLYKLGLSKHQDCSINLIISASD